MLDSGKYQGLFGLAMDILNRTMVSPKYKPRLDQTRPDIFSNIAKTSPGGRGVLPSKRLLGMCRWMGSHFHYWTGYNGATFLVEVLEWGRNFSGFLG